MMADVHDKNTRSYNMSRIKGQDTKPEILVRKYIHGKGLRYSLHNKGLLGKPDLCFKKYMKDFGWSSLIVWACELKPQNKEQALGNLYLSIITV